jgi:hypothetical protein
LTYKEIIKKGFSVANHNLAVLLTQSIAGVAMLMVFLLMTAGLVLAGISALPKLGLDDINIDTIGNLLQTYFSLVFVAALLGLMFFLVAALITAFVHAGNLGCVIRTARGETTHFTADTFFSTGRKSMLSMLGLYIIYGLITVGALTALLVIGGLGLEEFLIPLKESGRALTAFLLGVPFLILLITAALLVLFFLYGGWTFSGIILIGEKKGAFSSLSHAYGFIRKHFWDSLLFTLLMFVLVFAANTIITKVVVPFDFSAETKPAAAFAFLPLLLIGAVLQMYVGLIARACFAVYYTTRTQPPPEVPAFMETPEKSPDETPGALPPATTPTPPPETGEGFGGEGI